MAIFGTSAAGAEVLKIKLLSSICGHVPGTYGNKMYSYDAGAIVPWVRAEALKMIDKGLAVEVVEPKDK